MAKEREKESRREPQPRIRIGGMAMENGVLFHSDRYWAMAVRDEKGNIRTASGRKAGLKRSSSLKRLPLVRSLVNLAETAALLPRVHAHGGRLPLPLDSPAVLVSTIAGVAGGFVLRNPKRRLPPLLEEALASALAVLPSLVALRRSQASRYHAAEHMSINAYEKGDAGDGAAAARPEHPRCGTNVLAPALVMMTLGNAAARRALGRYSHAARLGVSFLSLSGAVELILWAARNPDSPVARAFTAAGSEVQRAATTARPSREQLEVGLAALNELLRLEGVSGDAAAD